MITRFTLMALVILGCSPADKKETTTEASEIVSLDAKGFKESLDTSPDAIILDVRTPPEVAEGIIPGSINIDYNAPDFSEKISGLDKSKPYYVYCMGGVRSSKAADKMKAEGFTNVINLEGGYKSWVENGFETTKP
jgi:rhodanese-related sulfurtransferase